MRESASGSPRDFIDASGASLPSWIHDGLSEPGASDAASRGAIMARVRALPSPQRKASRLSPSMRSTRWARRGLLTPFGATALAGVLGLLLCVRTLTSSIALSGVHGAAGISTSAVVIGDTVLPAGGASGTLGQSLRDTLRIVSFALRGANVHSVSVVGDFNAWQERATQLHRLADGSWAARVVVPRDMVRFDFVVNDQPLRSGPLTRPGTSPASAESTRARLDTI